MFRSMIALAAHRLLIALTGTLIAGSGSILPVTAGSAESTSETVAPAPPRLKVRADRQYTNSISKASIAEGNVFVQLGDAELRADRIEFDAAYRTLYARGSVRYKRGKQYFQASSFRYNLLQKEGQLNDVYGVIDLEEPFSNPLTTSQAISRTTESPTQAMPSDMPPVACPPFLPPVPDWHPQPWAITAWGGQMIDADFGPTFLGEGRMRPEYLLGVGLQKRIMRAGPLAIELEADFFSHIAKKQQGGGYNQSTPYADLSSQSFGEGILGIGARIWAQPWLSFSVVEGISYYTDVSLYEKTFREKSSQLLNYLSFEVEAAISRDLSLVGRIHHRSGAFGLFNGVSGGSNGYLIGLRYRWGQETPRTAGTVMPPLPECEDPDREERVKPSSLSDRLDSIALGDGGYPQRYVSSHSKPIQQPIPPGEQQAMRTNAITKIDQRISDIGFKGSFNIERRTRNPFRRRESSIENENNFGGIRADQFKNVSNNPLLDGTISRWRVQAPKVLITKDGWKANRMGFTNDPFTPTQTRIEAENVIAQEQSTGEILISARRNRLILEEQLPIPITRRQRINTEEDVDNRWIVASDTKDRDGFFIGRKLNPIELGPEFTLSLQPQFLVQRANDAETDSYPAPSAAADSQKVKQRSKIGDLFGLRAELKGRLWDWDTALDADISTFNPQNFANGARYWGSIENSYELPWVGEVTSRLFGAYRYRTWNGSLGQTDVYSALGGFIEQKKNFNWGKKLSNSYLWRIGVGNYQALSFTDNSLIDNLRANFYGSFNSNYSIWRGKPAPKTPLQAYRYSPEAIAPEFGFNINLQTENAAYGNGTRQNTISLSGGPRLTLGTFSKPFLDYTKLSISGSATYKQGSSPFEFDQSIDLGTVQIGITQQIVGPVVLNAGVGFNVDQNSKYYGEMTQGNFELLWKRRSYDFGFFYDPYQSISGLHFRLIDFNFNGTGVPFVPYTPTNWMGTRNPNRPF